MKWQDLDDKKRRNTLIFAAIVSIALLALMWPSGGQRMRPMPRAVPVRTAPQAGRVAPPPVPPAPPPAKDAGMLGKWTSAPAALPRRGLCTLWLEVTKNADEPDKYTGAASLSCVPTAASDASKLNPAVMFGKLNPLAATMSGAMQKDDAIVFRIDKVLNGEDCGLSGFSVSKFGSQNLAAEFQDACGGGSILLRKAG